VHITAFARNVMQYREPTANNETKSGGNDVVNVQRSDLGQAREFRSGTRSLSRDFNGSANEFDTVFTQPTSNCSVLLLLLLQPLLLSSSSLLVITILF